jgi:hypothetical protein
MAMTGEQSLLTSATVDIAQGTLRGVHEDGVVVFRGVPYAAAPTDNAGSHLPGPHLPGKECGPHTPPARQHLNPALKASPQSVRLWLNSTPGCAGLRRGPRTPT